MLMAAELSLDGSWGRPSLKRVYTKFINKAGIANAHDASADVDACAQLYFKMLQMRSDIRQMERDQELSTKETPKKPRAARNGQLVGKLALESV